MVPSWAVLGTKEIGAAHQRALLGHTDLVEDADTAVIGYARQEYSDTRYVLALRTGVPVDGAPGATGLPTVSSLGAAGDPADVLGFTSITMPLRDNRSLLEFHGHVRDDVQHRGVGSALWECVRGRAKTNDRTTLVSYTSHPVPGDEPGLLVPPTGFGRIAPDPSTAFLRSRGLLLEQAERQSLLTLPVDPAELDRWDTLAAAKAGPDYRVTPWTGETPDEFIDDMAGLMRRMSVDVPTADVDYDEEEWDADRVRHQDARVTDTGHLHIRAIAHHVPTGEAAGFTVFEVPLHRTGFAYQNDTLVHGDHRGRSLGLLLKAANLRQLLQVRPDVERVHTWNAGENGHMLAINDLMGFRPVAWEGLWQLRT